MLDIRLIRSEPDRVKVELAKVGVPASQVDELLEADRVRREAIQAVEALRADRTKASNLIRDMKDAAERAVAQAEETFTRLMLEVPNLPHPDVPVGPDDSCNTVVRTEGQAPSFDF